MKRIFETLVYLLILLLGASAFIGGVFEPTLGWSLFSVLPAAAMTWCGTRIAAEQSRVAARRPRRAREPFPFILAALLFPGPYLFANWFVGSMLTAAIGEPHARLAVVRFADDHYNYGRRRSSTCQRVGAVVQTPSREISVSQCLTRYHRVLPQIGQTVYYRTHESFVGALVEASIYTPGGRWIEPSHPGARPQP